MDKKKVKLPMKQSELDAVMTLYTDRVRLAASDPTNHLTPWTAHLIAVLALLADVEPTLSEDAPDAVHRDDVHFYP